METFLYLNGQVKIIGFKPPAEIYPKEIWYILVDANIHINIQIREIPSVESKSMQTNYSREHLLDYNVACVRPKKTRVIPISSTDVRAGGCRLPSFIGFPFISIAPLDDGTLGVCQRLNIATMRKMRSEMPVTHSVISKTPRKSYVDSLLSRVGEGFGSWEPNHFFSSSCALSPSVKFSTALETSCTIAQPL